MSDSATSPKDPNTKRVLVDLPNDLVDYLKQAAKANNTTVAAELRRSIAADRFFDQREQEGGKVLIEQKNGKYLLVTRK